MPLPSVSPLPLQPGIRSLLIYARHQHTQVNTWSSPWFNLRSPPGTDALLGMDDAADSEYQAENLLAAVGDLPTHICCGILRHGGSSTQPHILCRGSIRIGASENVFMLPHSDGSYGFLFLTGNWSIWRLMGDRFQVHIWAEGVTVVGFHLNVWLLWGTGGTIVESWSG